MSQDSSYSANVIIAVPTGANDADYRRAAALAEALGLPLDMTCGTSANSANLRLVVSERRVELRDAQNGHGRKGISVDFVHGPTGFRRRSAQSSRQPLAAAVGIGRGTRTVLDATAGMGRDAFLMACWGREVVAVERCPILGALLHDGIVRAMEGSAAVRAAVERITLIVADARDVLDGLAPSDRPDVVFLDPMYPQRKKKTLPKKELQLCRSLVGDDADAADLFDVAYRTAGRRVVVKRPPHAPPLAPKPDLRYGGNLARYDVYFSHRTTIDGGSATCTAGRDSLR